MLHLESVTCTEKKIMDIVLIPVRFDRENSTFISFKFIICVRQCSKCFAYLAYLRIERCQHDKYFYFKAKETERDSVIA